MAPSSRAAYSLARRGRYDPPMATVRDGNPVWTEVGDRVFVRRYRFFDQDIVAVLGGEAEVLLVDTRSTPAQAREILDDLRELRAGPVSVVVNTHGHHDHVFGNAQLRPAPIWGHERCKAMIEATGEEQLAGFRNAMPDLADELAEVVLDPPDQLFSETATIDLGGREIRLAYLGRGHTDNDIVVSIPDADVLCAGDLLENGAPPYFGDGYPIDWPGTVETMRALVGDRTVVVPGHGDHAGLAFVQSSLEAFRSIASLASRIHAGELDVEAAIALSPYPPGPSREPLERAVAQLRGELDLAPA
jgi:glyoxylase-like metal-dependent hydrolase (beta-lactamase superfamily II)